MEDRFRRVIAYGLGFTAVMLVILVLFGDSFGLIGLIAWALILVIGWLYALGSGKPPGTR